jgi:glycosyltransferase involved in cell wall biosynthesis
MQIFQNQDPLVSICIPVYNAEKTIGKTIASILNQKYKNLEITVVDNCSTDSTVKIAQSFNDPRIRIVLNMVHFSLGEYNWNRCFAYANGEFLAIFHADDIYLPDMVSRQIETFKMYPSVGGVFSRGNIINEDDDIIGEFKLPPQIMGGIPYTYEEIFNVVLEYADFLPTSSAMLRRDIYLKLSPFRYDQFGSASDFDMWLRASACAPIVILDEKLMNYRVSKTQGSNVLNRLKTYEADYFKVMDFHIEKYKQQHEISERKLNSYELSRFGDQLICVRNSVYKRDWKKFKEQIKKIPWLKYSRIIIRNPGLLRVKFWLLSYFKIFRAN